MSNFLNPCCAESGNLIHIGKFVALNQEVHICKVCKATYGKRPETTAMSGIFFDWIKPNRFINRSLVLKTRYRKVFPINTKVIPVYKLKKNNQKIR